MILFDSLPVIPLRITSRFGKRNTGIKGASTFHKGIDLGRDRTKRSTPILAVCDGVVAVNQMGNVRGWYIIIRHDDTYATLYQHLREQSPLKPGNKVKAGQVIGFMGNSSKTLTIAEHLHFELWKNGTPIDPEPYLTEDKMVLAELRKIIQEEIKQADSKPSAWAKEDWDAAKKEGLFDGTAPKGCVTREQLAVVIKRAIKK